MKKHVFGMLLAFFSVLLLFTSCVSTHTTHHRRAPRRKAAAVKPVPRPRKHIIHHPHQPAPGKPSRR